MGWFTSSKKFDVNSYSTSLSRGGQVEFPMERDGMKGHLLGLTILLSNCRHLWVFTGKLHSLGSNHHMLGLLKGWSMSFGDHNRCIHWKAASLVLMWTIYRNSNTFDWLKQLFAHSFIYPSVTFNLLLFF